MAKTLGEGGEDMVGALDQRITEVTGTINRAATTSPTRIAAKAAEIDTHARRAARSEVADHLDSRIGRFEELLVGRAEKVTNQIETRTKAAADALNARMEQLSQTHQDQRVASRARARPARASPPATRSAPAPARPNARCTGVERRGRRAASSARPSEIAKSKSASARTR